MQACHHKSHCLQHVAHPQAMWWKPCHVMHKRKKMYTLVQQAPPTGQVVETMSCYAQEEKDAHTGSAGLPGYRLRVLGHFLKHCNEEATGIRVMRQNAHASLQRELVCLSVWKHTLGQLVSLILQHENTGLNNRCTTGMQNPVQPVLRKRKIVVETSHARPGPAIIHPHGEQN